MPSLRQHFPKRIWLLNGLLLAAAVTYVIGVTAPIMTLKKLFFITHTFSVVSGIHALFEEREWFLFALITLFSLVLPVLKLGLLTVIANLRYATTKKLDRWLRLLAHYGKWSMLDVMIVAILFVSIKLGGLVSLQVHYGIYVFACSVLLTMVATWLAEHLAEQRGLLLDAEKKTGET